MTVLTLTNASGALPIRGSGGRGAHVETYTDLRPLSAVWQALQSSGVATPYQTAQWIGAWVDAMPDAAREQPCFAVLRDDRGEAIAIWPLAVRTAGGLRIASFLGGKHANLAMAVHDSAAMAALSADALIAALRMIAERRRIDLFHFTSQPFVWEGAPNPMARLPHVRSANSAWKTALARDPDATLRGILSSESRKKLRAKERRLGEKGEVRFAQARSDGEAAAALDAFFRQKAQRFRSLGIADPFADLRIRDFLRRAAVVGLEDGAQAVTLFTLSAGARIVAVFGGAGHQTRFSGMFTAFDPDPEIARFSPGDILLAHLVRTLSERGTLTFDLGTGDSPYKSSYCPTEEALFDSVFAATPVGRAASGLFAAATAAKRALKRSAPAYALISRARRLLPR